MATTKPDYTYKWASDGDKIAPSDAKIQTGWSPEIPPYQWENWIQNRQDEMLAHINERGIPEWDNRTNYVGGGKSYVQGSDGKVYKSVAASGPASVVSNPTTDVGDTYWTVAFADVGAFLTQATGDTRYTQRSNNLSDITDKTLARSNLGLGTAATANLTTSNIDNTAGRVLKVGDGGILGVTIHAGYEPDLNDLNIFRVGTKCSFDGFVDGVTGKNAPDLRLYGHGGGEPVWGVVHTYGTPSRLVQTCDFPYRHLLKSFTRYRHDDTWSPWTKQLSTNDMLLTTGSSTDFPMSQKAVSDQLLGVGQAWQDVTASRSVGVTYTNTTGRPIQVFVTFDPVGTATHFQVDGINILPQADSGYYHVACIIPAGSTYSLGTNGSAAMFRWVELR